MATTTKKRTRPSIEDNNSGIESRFRDVSEVESHLKCLFYGRSGTGKTTIAGTFPGPHLLLDVRDKGTKSIMKVPGIKVFQVESWADFEEVYWYLKNNPDNFKTVTIDTITQLQELCMIKVKGTSDISKTSRGAWGEVGEYMKAWIVRYRDLPMHVNIIAQPRIDTEENDNEELSPDIGPAVSPSIQKILTAAVDIVGYTHIRKTEKKTKSAKTGKVVTTETNEYCLRVGPHPIIYTKFRRDKTIKGVIPDVLSNADYQALLSLTIGEE